MAAPSGISEYRLALDVDVDGQRWDGRVEFDTPPDLEQIDLDSEDLTVRSVTGDGRSLPFELDRARHRLQIRPGVPRPATIRIEFAGRVDPERLVGLYRCAHGDGTVLTTQCEPTSARRVFPCVDRPDAKARIALAVRAPADLEVVSNVAVDRVDAEGGRRAWTFPPTPPMATYLFYLGIGKFDRIEDASGRVPVRVLTPPGRGPSGRFAAESGSRILRAYETYYGIDYPLPKLDMVAVSEHAFGAMENWGAMSFRDVRLLIEESSASNARADVFETVCHEIAHQWFGNLVTMAWWTDIWLNESFATFLEARITEELAPEFEPIADLILRPWGMRAALEVDAYSGTHPVRARVDRPEEISQTTDEITYGKGASVLRMMHAYLGEDPFRAGVTDYLNRFRYRNARTDDLWEALGRSSGVDVASLIAPWIDRPGCPIVHAGLEGDHLLLRQERFSQSGRAEAPPWPIPLALDLDGQRQRLLFDTRERTVPVPRGAVVHLNPGAVGYYRVAYDAELLERLRVALPSRPPIDRWPVLNDLGALLLAGTVDWPTYERFVRSVGWTSERMVVDEVAETLVRLALSLPGSPAISELARSYLADLTELVGLDRRPEESMTARIVRELVTASRVQIDERFARSMAMRFEGWDRIDPDLRWAVAIARARSDGGAGYREIRRTLAGPVPEGEALRLELGLAWAGEPELVRSTLDLVDRGEINRGHIFHVVRNAAANPVGRPLVGPWLEESLPQLERTFRGSALLPLLLENTIPLVGLGRAAETRAFYRAHPLPDATRGVAKGLERLEVIERFAERVGR